MKKLLILVTLTTLLRSCIFIRMGDSIDLGSNYRYIPDAPQVIIYHASPKYEGVGTIVVPPVVKSYAYDDRYIIAKSQEVDEKTGIAKGKPIKYWLIDKEFENAVVRQWIRQHFTLR